MPSFFPKFLNAITILRKAGVRALFRKIISFGHMRFSLALFSYCNISTKINISRNILNNQSHDYYSLQFNKFISAIIIVNAEKIRTIIVPNFLKSVFSLSFKYLDVDVLSYADAHSLNQLKNTLLIMHGPMVRQIYNLKEASEKCRTVFHNPGYVVLSTTDIELPAISCKPEWPDLESQEKIECLGKIFYVRPNTMDSGIISEVESEYISWLDQQIKKPASTIVDIGGHIGAFSILANKYLAKGGVQYIFEPVPENFQYVTKNIDSNKLAAIIQAFDLAVSDKAGNAIIHISSDNTGGSRLHLPDPSSQKSTEVGVTTLNDIIKDHNIDNIDILKIDVEGSEHAILYSSEDILKKKVKFLICEAGGSIHGDGDDVLTFLNKIGFQTEHHGNKGLMLIYAINSEG